MLQAIADKDQPGTVKVFNLLKAIDQLTNEEGKKEPYLISIGKKAQAEAPTMGDRHSMLRVFATVVRSASMAALAIEVCVVAVTAGGADWAPVWRLGLGFRFWWRLGNCGMAIAVVCLLASAVLVLVRRWVPERSLRDARRCICLNVATLVLAFFVPAIAAL